tara:strand:- start:1533 stop:1778 length:246 start_codon:yes stop_codon:yes gene_type:complete
MKVIALAPAPQIRTDGKPSLLIQQRIVFIETPHDAATSFTDKAALPNAHDGVDGQGSELDWFELFGLRSKGSVIAESIFRF